MKNYYILNLFIETLEENKDLKDGIEETIEKGLTTLNDIVECLYNNQKTILNEEASRRKKYIKNMLFKYLNNCYIFSSPYERHIDDEFK